MKTNKIGWFVFSITIGILIYFFATMNKPKKALMILLIKKTTKLVFYLNKQLPKKKQVLNMVFIQD